MAGEDGQRDLSKSLALLGESGITGWARCSSLPLFPPVTSPGIPLKHFRKVTGA